MKYIFLVVRDLPHIQLQDVTASQLICYDAERDLLPLILAQCNYSLEVGKGTLVQYNWEALERQLIDRFIRGRPLIDFKVRLRTEEVEALRGVIQSFNPFFSIFSPKYIGGFKRDIGTYRFSFPLNFINCF